MRTADRRVLLFIAVPVAIAAALRLTALDSVPFSVDQVGVLAPTLDLLAGRAFPGRGPDIGPGVFEWGTLGPLEYYVMAPLLAVARPLLGTVRGSLAAFVLYGLIALPLTYRLVERHLGDRSTALAATILYATAPYPWYLARELNNNSFLAPSMVLFFLALCEVLDTRSRTWCAVAGGALAAAMQFHITTVVFLPVLAAVLLAARATLVGWLGGAAAGALVHAPFLVAQVTTGFPDLRRMLAVAAGHAIGQSADRAGLAVIGLLRESIYETTQTPYVETAPWIDAAGGLVIVAIVVGLLTALARPRPRRGSAATPESRVRTKRALIAVWLLLPAAFLFTQRTEVFARHLALVFPAPYILAALGLSWLGGVGIRDTEGWARGAPRLVMALSTLFVTTANLTTIVRYRRHVADGGLIAGQLSLGAETAFATALSELGVEAHATERIALAGGGGDIKGIHFLQQQLAGAAASSEHAPARRVLLVAPSDGPDPILAALAAHGWQPKLGILMYEPSLDPGSVTVRRAGRTLGREDLATFERGEPGRIEIAATLVRPPDTPVLLVADTNLCFDGLTVGPARLTWDTCAPGEVPPWANRVAIEVPSTVPPGVLPVRLDARNPVERLYLRLFDVTLPVTSPLAPLPALSHGVEVRLVGPATSRDVDHRGRTASP